MERRKRIKNTPPPQLAKPDFSEVIKMIQDGLQAALDHTRDDRMPVTHDDFSHYLEEEVFKAIWDHRLFSDRPVH
jgi:hypothetical protein